MLVAQQESLNHDEDFASLAKALRVRVRRGGQTRVELTFKARVITHIEDILPGDLLPKLQQRGVCLQSIVQRAREKQFPPGILFEHEEGDKHVCVWLE